MKLVPCAIGFMLAISGSAALAQSSKYPSRVVRMLVGFSPSGATDIVVRLISPGLTESLEQSVVVENRPGASSQTAEQFGDYLKSEAVKWGKLIRDAGITAQ